MKETGFFAEFKKFITRGNVIDMAIGVIIGAAFNAIVNSLVADIINPVIGLATGGVNFSAMIITLKEATETNPALTINIGVFINTIINFLIIALILFIIVKAFNKMNEARQAKEKEAAAAVPPAKSDDVILLEEIRDLLKKQSN